MTLEMDIERIFGVTFLYQFSLHHPVVEKSRVKMSYNLEKKYLGKEKNMDRQNMVISYHLFYRSGNHFQYCGCHNQGY